MSIFKDKLEELQKQSSTVDTVVAAGGLGRNSAARRAAGQYGMEGAEHVHRSTKQGGKAGKRIGKALGSKRAGAVLGRGVGAWAATKDNQVNQANKYAEAPRGWQKATLWQQKQAELRTLAAEYHYEKTAGVGRFLKKNMAGAIGGGAAGLAATGGAGAVGGVGSAALAAGSAALGNPVGAAVAGTMAGAALQKKLKAMKAKRDKKKAAEKGQKKEATGTQVKKAAVGTNTARVALQKHPTDGSKKPGSVPLGGVTAPRRGGISGKSSGFRVGSGSTMSAGSAARAKTSNRSA